MDIIFVTFSWSLLVIIVITLVIMLRNFNSADCNIQKHLLRCSRKKLFRKLSQNFQEDT